jgi:ATP-dependent DNA helicase RecG
MSRFLESPIEFLKGVGPQRGALLRKELNINTFGDLLQHYPFRYVDRSVIQRIRDINPHTQFIQLKGKVSNMRIVAKSKQSD